MIRRRYFKQIAALLAACALSITSVPMAALAEEADGAGLGVVETAYGQA